MRPVRFEGGRVVDPTMPKMGDLFCERVEPGVIRVIYQPDEAEKKLIDAGGYVELLIWTEPIPPISLNAIGHAAIKVTGPHPFKEIPELQDEERR